MPGRLRHESEVDIIFKTLMSEYSSSHNDKKNFSEYDKKATSAPFTDLEYEKRMVVEFINDGCGCKNNCYKLFSVDEFLESRIRFSAYTLDEKNYYLLG